MPLPDFSKPVPGSEHYKDDYNDLDVAIDDEIYDQLVSSGKNTLI
jgi:hypothetical protein